MKQTDLFGETVTKGCGKCSLNKKRTGKLSKPVGMGAKRILFVTTKPIAENSDEYKFLEKELILFGIDLFEDCLVSSSIQCIADKKITDSHIKNCKHYLDTIIETFSPKIIVPLGTDAIRSILLGKVQTSSARSLSGRTIPFKEKNCWVLPMLRLSEIEKASFDNNMKAYFKSTLKQLAALTKQLPKFPMIDFVSPIEITTDVNVIEKFFNNLYENPEETAIDFETTSVNPFKKDQIITCMSVSTKDKCLSFPIDHPDGFKYEEDFQRVLLCAQNYFEDEKIPKIAHRSQFEKIWAEQKIGCSVNNMAWCTKIGEHICDNREGITGLKHLAFVRWGISGWDETAAKYIDTPTGIYDNSMTLMPLNDQLMYCGIDSFLTLKACQEQRLEMKLRGLLKPMSFFNEVNNMFSEMTTCGIHVDMSYYENKRKELLKIVKDNLEVLYESQEVIGYLNWSGKSDINFNSSDDLKEFFYGYLKLESTKMTAGGGQSVDEEALKKTKHWIAKKIIFIRKIEKIVGTYIAQFEREEINGKIRPLINVDIPQSYRSSTAHPNFQNLPVRALMGKLAVRSGLKPSPGNRLIEIDFSGAEVGTSAAYNKDPNLIEYLNPKDVTKAGDMHQDNAADIWMTPKENISKMVRFYAKNGWTFPQFYGDWYESCAKALWEHRFEKLKDGTTCYDSLKNHGIKTLTQFIEHCKSVQNIMWGQKFSIYDKWRKQMQIFYQQNLYISTYLGFQFIGYMDRKQTTNYQIQGTSFHLLLIVLLKMKKWLKEKELKTKLVSQIHDSGIFDSPENEWQIVIKQFEKFALELWNEYSWMEVPMKAEGKISLIDGDFGHMFDVEWGLSIEEMEKKAKEHWIINEQTLLKEMEQYDEAA